MLATWGACERRRGEDQPEPAPRSKESCAQELYALDLTIDILQDRLLSDQIDCINVIFFFLFKKQSNKTNLFLKTFLFRVINDHQESLSEAKCDADSGVLLPLAPRQHSPKGEKTFLEPKVVL